MTGISLAEINAVIDIKSQITLQKVCPRQSDIIFCSNPECNLMPLSKDRLKLLKQGWEVISDAWYCPQCALKIKK